MALSAIRTQLPLDRWAEILGINPLHFNQVTDDAVPNTVCSRVWKQWAWQESDQVSRLDAALAISQAEQVIITHLGYNLVPEWTIDERVRATQPGIPEVLNVGGLNVRGFNMTTKTEKGHIISGGIEGKTLIEAGAIITFLDQDGDGYFETARVTVTSSVDPDEIAVYYPGEDGADEWEIRPLNNPLTHLRRVVDIGGGLINIIFAREQVVDPLILSDFNPGPADGSAPGDFLATVDVFRHFNDPQQQVTLLWAPHGQFCDCGTTTCVVCAHSTQTGCLLANDFRTGRFHYRPAAFNATTGVFDAASFIISRNPDNLRLFYYSGFQDRNKIAPRVEMADDLARAITYLSLTYLTRELCDCNNVEQLAKAMREDLSMTWSTQNDSRNFSLSPSDLANPFGTMRGSLYAWRFANQRGRAIGEAVVL